MCKITEVFSVQVAVAECGTKMENKLDICKQEREKNTPENHLWKRDIAAKYVWVVSQDNLRN